MMERSPTYEEVQAFAKSEGLDSKTDIKKFYQYYSETGFLYKGIPMDWKAKLREWAKTERPRRSKTPTMADYGFEFDLPKGFDSMKEYLDWVIEQI